MIPSHITAETLNQHFNVNMTKVLGIEYTEVGDDYICATMPVDERTKQPLGVLHGGASVVLAESLGSLGANCLVDPETHFCVGQEINANHVKKVSEGYVHGKATAIHVGRSTQIWEIKIINDNGDLVCISRLTVAVVPKKK